MSKYLKLFNQDAEYKAFKESEEYILPNVSFVESDNVVYYNPYEEVKLGVIMARYNATEENKLAIADTSNVKSLKVNGTEVEFGDTYYFSEIGEYDVEIELIDTTLINGINMNSDVSKTMFWGILNYIPTGACLTSIIIPDSVTSIGERAFESCRGLLSVHIGSGVTTIGLGAFMDCTSLPVEDNLCYADTYLVGVTDYSLSTYTIKEGTKWIGDGAFSYCESLTSVNIPDSVTYIGNNAFSNCSELTGELVIPDSVKTIGTSAFAHCSGLTSVHIPDSVTSIDGYAFYNCSGLPVENNLRYADTYLVEAVDKSLSTYTIQENTKWVGDRAFENCSGLTSIVIPDSVTSIGELAFNDCSGLTSITCFAPTAPTIDRTAFQYIKKGGILKVPAGSDYSTWMSTSYYYLGSYNWTIEYI